MLPEKWKPKFSENILPTQTNLIIEFIYKYPGRPIHENNEN